MNSLPFLRLLLILAFSTISIPGSRGSDEDVLRQLIGELAAGSSSLNTSAPSPCHWRGVVCTDDKRVTNLTLSGLQLQGSIPTVVGQLESLKLIDFSNNSLSGTIPAFGNCSSLVSLDLSQNSLSGSISVQLTNCSQLERLYLGQNMLNGSIPSEIGMLQHLTSIDLSQNHFTGTIPPQFGGLTSLSYFEVYDNQLTGIVPPSISHCQSLTLLNLSGNRLNGTIPAELSQMSSLQGLNFSGNLLSGSIPPSNRTRLIFLDLSGNLLSGNIPADICNPAYMERLLLGDNALIGGIPAGIGNCNQLLELQLGGNNLSGEVPAELGSAINLQIALNLSHNLLMGNIPSSFGSLTKLVVLDISSNRLNGSIRFLQGMQSLTEIDLAYNNFSGPIPTFLPVQHFSASSFEGNEDLCGPPLPQQCAGNNSSTIQGKGERKTNLARSVAEAAAASAFVAVVIVAGAMVACKFRRHHFSESQQPDSVVLAEHIFSEVHRKKISLGKAVEEALDEANTMRKNRFSTLYKVEMPSGITVLVKKLAWTENVVKSSNNSRKLTGELEKLGGMNHENVMNPVGYVLLKECALLLYEHTHKYCLAELLYGSATFVLDWSQRKKIALGTAHGLMSLHRCKPPLIHLDISSKNILLNSAMEVKLGDAELSKLLDPSKSTAASMSTIAGSVGYIPPEYAYTMSMTKASNVYSFGVVLLELLTGRPPTGRGMNLAEWVHLAPSREETPEQVLDARLVSYSSGEGERQEILTLLTIALRCTSSAASARPTMEEVIQLLYI